MVFETSCNNTPTSMFSTCSTMVTMTSVSKATETSGATISVPMEQPTSKRTSVPIRGGRYVLIIHFYVESGQKMIQFNIQFKIESKIFIQWIIHSIFSQKYRFNELFIQYSVRNIDSKFYSKNWIKTIQIYVIKPTQWKPAKRERFP